MGYSILLAMKRRNFWVVGRRQVLEGVKFIRRKE